MAHNQAIRRRKANKGIYDKNNPEGDYDCSNSNDNGTYRANSSSDRRVSNSRDSKHVAPTGTSASTAEHTDNGHHDGNNGSNNGGEEDLLIDAIDFNLGCPQDRARTGKYGPGSTSM